MFTYKDVNRIVFQVRPVGYTTGKQATEEGLAVIGTVLAANADFWQLMLLKGWNLVPQQQLTSFLLQVTAWIIKVLAKVPQNLAVDAWKMLAGFLQPSDVEAILEEKEEATDGPERENA